MRAKATGIPALMGESKNAENPRTAIPLPPMPSSPGASPELAPTTGSPHGSNTKPLKETRTAKAGSESTVTAPREVATTARTPTLRPSIRPGTMTMPPPMPNDPLSRPAAKPLRSVVQVAPCRSGGELRGFRRRLHGNSRVVRRCRAAAR